MIRATPATPEHKAKIAESKRSHNLSPETIERKRQGALRALERDGLPVASNASRTTFYANRSFRSGSEAQMAQILDELKIEWNYESIGIRLPKMNRIYYPDFYLPSYDKYVEVKGRAYPVGIAKIEEFQTLGYDLQVFWSKDNRTKERRWIAQILQFVNGSGSN